ncbi:YfgM family protein [Marinobacterium sp. YM272]|uniref:YfgM family protein n=1 Tax=Marinobacterium sp. YM272 TaxID=3421654 RepID=UPI003D7F501F
MAELRTEEEQVEAIKNWWKENGRSVLLAIAVAVAGVFGWQAWEKRVEAQSTNASITYQELLDAVMALRSAPEDEAQLTTAKHLAGVLQDDYESSGYAALGAMLMARVAVDSNDLDQAFAQLDWVRQNAEDAELKQLATLRSARIKLAQGDADAADALLKQANGEHYQASYQELRGDVLVAQGQLDQARQAYEQALEGATPQMRPVIEMKRDDLAQGENS